MPVPRARQTGQAPSLPKKDLGRSAEETDFRIPGNHRASDDHYDDHNSEFHIALTMLPLQSNRQRSAYVLLQRRQGYESGGVKQDDWNAESVKGFRKPDSAGTSTSASQKTSAVKASMVAALRQASSGRPALRQVCSRKVSRSQPYSTGTWGSSRPRRAPSEMTQAVAPDFHGLGMNREEAGEHAQRNLQLQSFFLGHRQESGIVESGGAGRFGHGAIQRRDGQRRSRRIPASLRELCDEVRRGRSPRR